MIAVQVGDPRADGGGAPRGPSAPAAGRGNLRRVAPFFSPGPSAPLRWCATAALGAAVSCAAAGSRSARPAPAAAARVGAAGAAPASAAVAPALAGAAGAAGAAPPATTEARTAPLSATTHVDVPYWATPEPIVEVMLELAEVRATDLVYDLGCGDARILVTAAKRYGARGFGVDIDPRRVAEARGNARRNGVDHLVRIERADIFSLDLSPADVVFLYLLTRLNDRLVPQLEALRPGARIVSHEFDIPRARPTRILRVPGPPDGPPETDGAASTILHTLYLWRMPWQRRPVPAVVNQPCWSTDAAPPPSPCAVTGD